MVKNDTLGQIKWEQMIFLGNPEYGVDLYPIDFCGVAKACGVNAYHIEDPADSGPALIEAVVDPFEPPMPAKITGEQALHFAESLARGEPNRTKIAWTTLTNKIREMV